MTCTSIKVKDALPSEKQSKMVYQRDHTETGDKDQGTPGCLQEKDDGEVSFSDEGEGRTTPREAIYSGIPDPLQLWEDLHQRDHTETREKDQGTPGCL